MVSEETVDAVEISHRVPSDSQLSITMDIERSNNQDLRFDNIAATVPLISIMASRCRNPRRFWFFMVTIATAKLAATNRISQSLASDMSALPARKRSTRTISAMFALRNIRSKVAKSNSNL